jgi:hypothetical protein
MPYVPVVANPLEQAATPEDTTENSDADASEMTETSEFLS